ncbi:MAG: transpeptidase family protein [Bacteroidales bacterium]|nr:transpeptidase family protein [Bacteroidales bacterium]
MSAKNIKKDILWRVYLVYLGILAFAFIIIGKAVFVLVYEGDEWKSFANEQRVRYEQVKAVRGNIFASDGSLIATSIPLFDIRMDAATPHLSDKIFYDNIDSLAYRLSHLFKDRSQTKYKQIITQARTKTDRYFLIKRRVTYSELNALKHFPIFKLGKYKGGLIIIPRTKREMPFSLLAARTIGYESQNANAYVGLEGAYSDYLRGTGGMRLVRKMAQGVWAPVNEKFEIEPQNGCDIITTIDMNIQDVAENALLKQLQEHDAHHGCAILMEVETGHIKAIANLKKNNNGIYEEIYNYAVGESSEPGSTFKLVSMMAALEDGLIDLTDSVYTGDGWTVYYGRTMRDSHKIGDGNITMKTAFEHSSNVGISGIIEKAYKNNPEKFCERLYSFGIQNTLGIEIQGEGKPDIKTPDHPSWSNLSLPWMATGYEVALTPLQLLTFYNAVANDGIMVKPMLVTEIMRSGVLVKTFKTEVINKSICSNKTIEKAKELLVGVVEQGTAKNLKNPVYKIAGKTGTAQLANKNEGYNKTDYKASFVGYFPADNPKYSCIVIINRPSKGIYYGSLVAGPVFKEIADKVYATQMNIYQEEIVQTDKRSLPNIKTGYKEDLLIIYSSLGYDLDTSNSGRFNWGEALYKDNGKITFCEHTPARHCIPDVVGMGAKNAVYLLENLGLRTKIHGCGHVKKQSINPGKKIETGDEVTLILASN